MTQIASTSLLSSVSSIIDLCIKAATFPLSSRRLLSSRLLFQVQVKCPKNKAAHFPFWPPFLKLFPPLVFHYEQAKLLFFWTLLFFSLLLVFSHTSSLPPNHIANLVFYLPHTTTSNLFSKIHSKYCSQCDSPLKL